MLQVFISMPMQGLSGDQIYARRQDIEQKLTIFLNASGVFKHNPLFVINNYNYDIPEVRKDEETLNIPLYCLGRSITALSFAQIFVRAKNWQSARGCQIENDIIQKYGGVFVIDEEDLDLFIDKKDDPLYFTIAPHFYDLTTVSQNLSNKISYRNKSGNTSIGNCSEFITVYNPLKQPKEETKEKDIPNCTDLGKYSTDLQKVLYEQSHEAIMEERERLAKELSDTANSTKLKSMFKELPEEDKFNDIRNSIKLNFISRAKRSEAAKKAAKTRKANKARKAKAK